MAVDLLELDNWISYEGKGWELLDAYVTETIKQNDLMEDHKQYKSILDFTDTTLLNADQKFSSRTPNGGLKDITEAGIKNQREFAFWPKKGLSQREIGDKFTMTYLFTQWARKAKNLKGAPESVQAELVLVKDQSQDLVQGYDITFAEELVGVPAKGFSVVSVWDGLTNACARDGLALFSAVHELKDWTTFSNIVTGAAYTSIAVGQTQLQSALDALKTMKFDNGKKVEQVKWEAYKLYCSRVKETFWLSVINDGSDNSGVGTNSAQKNTFNFKNNLVEVVVLDLLWDTDSNGDAIGTDEMFFVANPKYIRKAKALRCANLYSPRIKTWENDETDEMNTSIRAIVGAGSFDLEFWMIGSTWV